MVMTDMLHSEAFMVLGKEVTVVNPIQKCSVKFNLSKCYEVRKSNTYIGFAGHY